MSNQMPKVKSETTWPKGPWVWGHPQGGSEVPPLDTFHASLYAPHEVPHKRFVLEAQSIGDGDAMPIRNLVAAAPDLYDALWSLMRWQDMAVYSIVGLSEWNEYELMLVLDAANAALEKARGES